MVDIKSIIEVLNGVEDNLKEQLKAAAARPHISNAAAQIINAVPDEVGTIHLALVNVQSAISELLQLG